MGVTEGAVEAGAEAFCEASLSSLVALSDGFDAGVAAGDVDGFDCVELERPHAGPVFDLRVAKALKFGFAGAETVVVGGAASDCGAAVSVDEGVEAASAVCSCSGAPGDLSFSTSVGFEGSCGAALGFIKAIVAAFIGLGLTSFHSASLIPSGFLGSPSGVAAGVIVAGLKPKPAPGWNPPNPLNPPAVVVGAGAAVDDAEVSVLGLGCIGAANLAVG